MKDKKQPPIMMQPDANNSAGWLPKQQQTIAVRRRYGDAAAFLNTFSPDLLPCVGQHVREAYYGCAPTLRLVSACYGEKTAIVWLCAQLEGVNLFCSARDKMDVERQVRLARLWLVEYPYLRVTEFMLFFYRLECGRYGHFYGAVDALFISAALVSFMHERRGERAQFDAASRRQLRAEAEAAAPACITYDEYLKWKQQKNNTNGNDK